MKKVLAFVVIMLFAFALVGSSFNSGTNSNRTLDFKDTHPEREPIPPDRLPL